MSRNAAYTHTLPQDMPLGDLLMAAELVKEATQHPGWQHVQDAIQAHHDRMYARLVNESTKVEEVPRLRGLLSGLASMREAAETILAVAEEREAEARKRNMETAHV